MFRRTDAGGFMELEPITGIIITLDTVLQKLDLMYAYETDELKRAQLLLINQQLSEVSRRFNLAFDETNQG